MIEERSSRVNYLDKKILKELCHKMACDLFQEEEPMGLYEDHDESKLDSCLNLPKAGFGGQELYPTVFKKAAITFYAFNRNHAFGNGNKRLSVAALAVFLYINDWALIVEPSEIRDKALWLAQTDTSIGQVVDELAKWAEEHCLLVAEFEQSREAKT